MRPQGITALLGGRSPLGCGEQTQLLLCCGCPVLLLLERVHGVNHKPDAPPEESGTGKVVGELCIWVGGKFQVSQIGQTCRKCTQLMLLERVHKDKPKARRPT